MTDDLDLDEEVEVVTSAKTKKRAPLYFGWCITGHHRACKVSNHTHSCECTCSDHGVDYAPAQATSPEHAMRLLKGDTDGLE